MAIEMMLTPGMVAAVLGMSPETIKRWCRTGKIEAVIIPGRGGGEWRIKQSAVERLIAGQAEGTLGKLGGQAPEVPW